MAQLELGELLIAIKADTSNADKRIADLEKQVSRAERNIDKQSGSIVTSFARWGAGLLTVQAVWNSVTRDLERVTAISRLSEVTGIATETLSGLAHAALQNGISLEQMSVGLQTLTRNIAAARDQSSQAALAFRALGVATEEGGRLRSTQAVLEDVIRAMSGAADGANKTQIAMALMSEGGARLLPVFNGLEGGLAGATQHARELGIAVNQETVTAMRAANKAAAEWEASTASLIREGWQLMPVLTGLVDLTTYFARGVREIAQGTSVWARELGRQGLITQLNMANGELENLGKQMLALVAERTRLRELGQPFEHLTPRILAAQERMSVISQTMRDMNVELREMAMGSKVAADGISGLVSGPVKVNPTTDLTSLERQREIMEDALASARAGLEAARVDLERFLNPDVSPFVTAMTTTNEAIKRVTETALKHGITFGQMSDHVIRLQAREREAILQTASVAAQTLTTVFAKNKGASIAAAVLNTSVAVTRALAAGPPPWNFAQAALVAAAGAAQIAQIRNTNSSGSSGNVAPVSGGGSDAGGQGGGQVNTLIVQGIDPNSLLTGASVRHLAQQLIDFQRDGGKVVLDPR